MKPLRVLIGCEFSGIVRDSFRALGHDAWSCDLLPCEGDPAFHIQGDVLEIIGQGWDLGIFHPPCTYLCSMGLWWNAKRPERIPFTIQALEFVDQILAAPIPCIALENPIGCINTRIRKPEQIIHPWQFGHEASKPTCLWLKSLPLLKPVKVVGRGRFYAKANGHRMAAWSHVTSGTNKEKRARIASRTFPGIAQAMAIQWSEFLSQPQS